MISEKEGINRKTKVLQNKIFFWEKLAFIPKNEKEDRMKFHEIEDDPSIKEVIKDLELKIMGKTLLFDKISPKHSSVKKWIDIIRENYPKQKTETVEDLLNTFRSFLYSYSRKKYQFIVGLFLMKDLIMIVHCKKDPSLAEIGDEIHSVKLILHHDNVLRAAIIKNENGQLMFSAFEYKKKWSKGHAEFWGIETENVGWESLGNITLNIELESFPHPFQLPIGTKDLDEMIKSRDISPTGNIRIGKENGKITSAFVLKKFMEFSDFFDYYINQKEKLGAHREKFRNLVIQGGLGKYIDSEKKYKFEEDEKTLYEITAEGSKPIYDKKHSRFIILFSNNSFPGIKPLQPLINKLYQSIFENASLDIFHAGIKPSNESFTIGTLNIYNKIPISPEISEFSKNLLNIIEDSSSKKKIFILQCLFCEFWKRNVKNRYIIDLLNFIIDSKIIPELEFQFKNSMIFDKEEHLEFKSASDVNSKPSKFVKETLIPTIRKYITSGIPKRLCIIYGFEDNGVIQPIYHLKSDQITSIEEMTNKGLINENIQISTHPIPFREGKILLIFIIPKTNSFSENRK